MRSLRVTTQETRIPEDTVRRISNATGDQTEQFLTHAPSTLGHIGVIVDNVEAACKRLEENGVNFIKKPNDGTPTSSIVSLIASTDHFHGMYQVA